MCGITGIITRNPLSPEQIEQVSRMNSALIHRGPDGAGEFHDANIALAMRRLSIIDLEGGWQPLYNEDRTLVLIANGEIYNFVELRKGLQARGHSFRTGSDCETILHLYEDHGAECVHHLRGMFSFALWDRKRRRLMLARDRMGEKPLYLYEREGKLVFASELKALMNSALIPFELDPEAVDLYFHYQYVPEPSTPIKGVRKLDAAHILTVDIDPWHVQESCYWRMEDAPPLDGDPTELILGELDEISELVIRSDVPVGVALSGGLDSSAVAALAARKYPDTMHAFSIGYPGRPPGDEREDAQALAKHLGMPFHEVELATDQMVAFFPELVYLRDDPIADISGFGYYAVMKLAREQNVPVMLQGQGGDELFWGYPWTRLAVKETLQKDLLRQEGWRRLPSYSRPEMLEGFKARQLRRWIADGFGFLSGWKRFRSHSTNPQEQMVFYDTTPDFRMARQGARSLYTSEFVNHLDGSLPEALFTSPQPWTEIDVRITRLVCESYLRENGIAQGDRLSMASSIELRLPLVDYRLVDTVIGLQKTQPDHQLPPKQRLHAALKHVLPDWVMNRPKRGFTPPVRQWHDALFATRGAQLDGGYLVESGILKPEAGKHLSTGPFPRGAVAPMSFKALVLETWCRQMLSHYGHRDDFLENGEKLTAPI